MRKTKTLCDHSIRVRAAVLELGLEAERPLHARHAADALSAERLEYCERPARHRGAHLYTGKRFRNLPLSTSDRIACARLIAARALALGGAL